jgi:folate-binding protein YgfZ
MHYFQRMSPVACLDDRAVIGVSGPEARDFLQGLITNDVRRLAADKPLYAALLTPQGKVLFDFLLHDRDGDILLDCEAGKGEALKKRLVMYRLRSKVTIEARGELNVVAAWDGAAALGCVDPRLEMLGRRAVVEAGTVPANAGGAQDYLAHRLECGVPEGSDFGWDRMFALDADLDELHAISFEKGCYVGQELTARMKHRGTARKRLLPVVTLDASPLPGSECAVLADGHEIGTLAAAHGAAGFALIRLDRLAESAQATPQIEGVPVRLVRPQWLSA